MDDDSIDTAELVEQHHTIADYIITPTRTVEVETTRQRPTWIYWEPLTAEEIESIPTLSTIRRRRDDTS
jgi:hypothetical protein